MVGRPYPHVVRGVLCEGDEGTAEVRDQHWLPPSASGGTLYREVLHPGVPVMWHTHIRDLSPTAEAGRGPHTQGNKVALGDLHPRIFLVT